MERCQSGKNLQMIDKVDVKNRVPPERTRVPGGGIIIPHIYFSHGANKLSNIKKI